MKSGATVPTADGDLRMEIDVISVPYMTAPDKSWRFTDEQGHEHYHADDRIDPYPTLRPEFGEEMPDGDRDEWLACKACGEEVRPGTTGPGTERIPGRASFYLGNTEITGDEYASRLHAHQASQVK